MKKLILSITTFALVLLIGCSKDVAGPEEDNSKSNSTIYGTIVLPATMNNAATLSRSEALMGSLSILAEDSVYVFQVDGTNLVGDSIIVPFSIKNIASGIKNLVYTADINVNSVPLSFSGYSLISVEKDDSTEVSQENISVIPSTDQNVAGAPLIILASGNETVTKTVVSVTGTVSNSDIPVIIINNNGNNYIFVDETSNNTFTFSQNIPLEVGKNAITVSAINKSGESFTTAAYTVELTEAVENKNSITATLSWNTAETDLDLHCWYYKASTPDFTSLPYQHTSYWNMNFGEVAPDLFISDTIIEEWVEDGVTIIDTFYEESANLDIDDVDGFGPEHITFHNYPDGYYIFAINSFDIYNLFDNSNSDPMDSTPIVTDYIMSLDVDSKTDVMKGTFRSSNEESYDVNVNNCWDRCFDVKVSNGVAEIIAPNSAFRPVESFVVDTVSDEYGRYTRAFKNQKKKRSRKR